MTRPVEVSIFGPGKGEAIAVHLGGGDWITVDSCRDQITKSHPVLDYFAREGVDPSSAVKLVVGTHAHDDHIAGISELFQAATEAHFVASSALTAEEFFSILEADEDIESAIRQRVRLEYARVYAEVERRGTAGAGVMPFQNAIQQRVLWERPATASVPSARVLALSPSDKAVQRARAALAKGLAKVGQRKHLAAVDPNELAVALWIEVGAASILLGADLLNGPQACGWEAVLATHVPKTQASLFKVAHHGSRNAHHDQVWTDLLVDDVISLLAPFRHGSVSLPGPEDVERIKAVSLGAYITASPKGPTRSSAVVRTSAALNGVASNVRDAWGRCGQVRAQLDESAGTWDVSLVSPARAL